MDPDRPGGQSSGSRRLLSRPRRLDRTVNSDIRAEVIPAQAELRGGVFCEKSATAIRDRSPAVSGCHRSGPGTTRRGKRAIGAIGGTACPRPGAAPERRGESV